MKKKIVFVLLSIIMSFSLVSITNATIRSRESGKTFVTKKELNEFKKKFNSWYKDLDYKLFEIVASRAKVHGHFVETIEED